MENRNDDNRLDPQVIEKMNQDWTGIRAQLRADFKHLRDEDLDFLPGQEEVILGKIERRIGKDRRYLESFIHNFGQTRR